MNWSFWIVGLVVCAGHAKLLAITENVCHSLGWSRPTLKRIRGIHNVLLFGIPAWAMWSCGSLGWSATPWWRELSFGWWLWIAWGLAGAVALVLSTVRHLTYRPPACQTACTSRIIDIQARVPESLVGTGRARKLAALPGNQQFTLEVNEKTYHLPRLPREWDGLSIVHFSDLHFRGSVTRRYFEEVLSEAAALNGDLIAFTGDLMDHRDCLAWIPSTLGRLSAPLGCHFVLGNHDWYLPLLDEMRAALRSHGWNDVSSRVIELRRDAARLILAGTELPWMGTAPDLSTADPDLFRVLLSHSPDQIAWARQQRVDLMLAGHTHGGQIRLPVLGPVYSPSRHSCRYASGVFWELPTLLHVTRGVSGREPIRYRCRPEVTKLVLRRSEYRRAVG
jgi:predicted MPP superfamily phosphohydrolase